MNERHGAPSSIQQSIDVAAPADVVWSLISDPARHTEFGTFVSSVTLVSPPPIAMGTVYREVSGPRFARSESEWTITAFEPPRRLVHEGREPTMESRFTWLLESIGPASTSVTQIGEIVMMPRLRPLGRLLELLFVKRMLAGETARMLADLKRLAEEHFEARSPTGS